MSFHRALSWVSVTKCAAGKHFVAAKSGNPAKCEACVSGTFNANDDSSADCAKHKTCEAGEWTKAAGNATTDTSCSKCSKGRFRAKAPTDNKAENETSVCRKRMSCTFKSIGACTAHKYAVAQTNFCCCRVYVLSCTRFYAQSTSTYCMGEKCTQA